MGRAVTQGQAEGWAELVARARAVRSRAYCPYSHFAVGVALETDQGEVYLGCNVENASYGLTLCAECGLVSDLARRGGGRLVAVSIVAGDGDPVAPCGRCRQLLLEHGGPALLVDNGPGEAPVHVADLLPRAFTGEEIAQRRSER